MKPRARLRLAWMDGEVDLVPMIDCVFLLLLFFLLCGRLTLDQRPEQITVPPGKTAHPIDKGTAAARGHLGRRHPWRERDRSS